MLPEAVAQAQALRVTDASILFLLTVSASMGGYGWGLWQKHGAHKVPVGFRSQLWKGAETCYSLLEGQLAAVYAAFLAPEGIGSASSTGGYCPPE